ncbi:MAG: DNA-processing protein DprA [Planctomycetes bacterium]|nr:DNA-processing protein DprA [Planctomycetota bacterium]
MEKPQRSAGAMAKTTIHTIREGNGWVNRQEGSRRASGVYRTQAEAVEAARAMAVRESAVHLIHAADGRIREQNTYSAEPLPPGEGRGATETDHRASGPMGLLTLLGLKGVGPQTAERLASRFEMLREIRSAAMATQLVGEVSSSALRSLEDDAAWQQAEDRAERVLEQAAELGVQLYTVADDEYPMHLKTIPDHPPVVFVRGCLASGPRTVACIGTREPTFFGVKVAKGITTHLAERGWSIVSGLAIGVDALAHEAALGAGGHTVAVLANGLDAIYPKANAALADRILASGGALLSEQPFGASAIPRNLVHRDRLQSGMSVGTIVAQTDIVGGSMHTVRFTLMQGRRLFAPVPRGPHTEEPKSRGIRALTEKTGAEFASLVEAKGEYAELLRRDFAGRPVANAFASRDDYQVLLEVLEQAATAPPAPKARKNSQGTLF